MPEPLISALRVMHTRMSRGRMKTSSRRFLIWLLALVLVSIGCQSTTSPTPREHLSAGFRYSIYGPDYNPGPDYWAEVGREMAARFPGAVPGTVWIVGRLEGRGTEMSFPGRSDDPLIRFTDEDLNEETLTLFDERGFDCWLQVEPGNASVEESIHLMLGRYGHHPCVVGVGVDVEWLRSVEKPDGDAVTDEEATAWLAAARQYNPDYRLFLKHWLTEKMPPTVREGLLFIDDSQIFPSLDALVEEFAEWGRTFSPAPVGFQYGYASDRPWWRDHSDPPAEIGNRILEAVPNAEALYWVDFTAIEVFPPPPEIAAAHAARSGARTGDRRQDLRTPGRSRPALDALERPRSDDRVREQDGRSAAPAAFQDPTPGGNPIITTVFTADPAPLVHDGRVYLYVGHDEARGEEMFTLRDWLVFSSVDMKNWTAHGPIMKATDFAWATRDAWAAEAIEKDGTFYFYASVEHDRTHPGKAIGVAVSDSPTGPFVDARGSALITNDMTPQAEHSWDDIDPTVFTEDDGTSWLMWGNGNCYLAKLKPSMIELDGPIRQIEVPHFEEGPWLHQRGDLYYLTYASLDRSQNPHETVSYATAPAVTGPWTYRGQLTGSGENSFTIHPAIIEFKDRWYFFYHNAALTIGDQTGAIGRRAVAVEHLQYNPDGTIRPIRQTVEGVSVPPRAR